MNFTKYCAAGKDYIFLSDDSAYDTIEKLDVKTLCDRQKGIGADGIFAIHQNSAKNGLLRGFLQNGDVMRDFSTASICAAFAANSDKSFKEYEFSCNNKSIFTLISDFDTSYPLISCDMGKADFNAVFPSINRKTEIGNRILTLTALYLHGIHTVHFSENKDMLDIAYLGQRVSENSLFNKQADLIIAEKTSNNSFSINYFENKTGNPRPPISAFTVTAVSACKTENAAYGEEIKVTSKDSTVYVFCKEDGTAVTQCSAIKVFSGSI